MDAFRKFLDSLSEEELGIRASADEEQNEVPEVTASDTLQGVRTAVETIRELIRSTGMDPIEFLDDAKSANALMFSMVMLGISPQIGAVIAAVAVILEVDGIQSIKE